MAEGNGNSGPLAEQDEDKTLLSDDSSKITELESEPYGQEAEKRVTYPHTHTQTFLMLTKFMLPLVVTQMVPDVAEQVLNRGITTIADTDMVQLLASFGLAYYVTRLIACGPQELRNISIVVVHSKKDNRMMSVFSLGVGVILTLFQLVFSLSGAGMWLIRDIHRQPQEVSQLACDIMAYLAPISLLESIAYYFEGGLIYQKRTVHAGIAKFADVGLQITFTLVLLFTPTRTEPVLVPLFALYAGHIGRVILCSGFWYIYARRKQPETHPSEKPVTIWNAVKFWTPLAAVKFMQNITRPAINLGVSRILAEQVSKEEAAKAIAVLTAVYPAGRILFSWLLDLRAVVPTFHKATAQHRKIPLKVLVVYSAFCTATVFMAHTVLYVIPDCSYFIMHKIVGLNEELAEMCILPLQIFLGLGLCAGVRGFTTGFLIMKKKTMFITPSGVARLATVAFGLVTFPRLGVTGATLGISCLLASLFAEDVFLVVTIPLVNYMPRIRAFLSCNKRQKKGEKDMEVQFSKDNAKLTDESSDS